MNSRILWARLVLTSCAAMLALATTAWPESPALSTLLPAGKTVPACAKLRPLPPDSNELCGITSNPYVSRDRKFVTCMATMLLGIGKTERVKPQQASEAGFVEYQSRAELGMMALRFDEARAATDLAASLERALVADPPARPGEQPRAVVLRSGTAVGFAACDSMFDEACCQQMLAHLKEVWSHE